MTNVLIAVDDSESSVLAAKTAHRVFGDTAIYTVLNVAHSGPVIWGDNALAYGTVYPLVMPGAGMVGGLPLVVRSADGTTTYDPIEAAEQTAQDVAGQAGLVTAESIGQAGDPADTILSAAREHAADVIVVGSPDRSWFQRLVSPSVTAAVLRDSDIPVLVCR